MIQLPVAYEVQIQNLQLDLNASVFDWNNRALLCMQQGKWTEAVAVLLHLTKRLESGQESTAQAPIADGGIASRTRSRLRKASTESSDEEAGDDENEMLMILITVPVNQELRDARIPPGAEMPFALFDQAFCPVMGVSSEDLLRQGDQLTLAFCCYNLALCLQYQENENVRLGRRPRAHPHVLQSALTYYKKALAILEPGCRQGRPEDSALLLCAINNNLGHLFCTLHRPSSEQEQQFRARNQQSQGRHFFQWIQALVSNKFHEHALSGAPADLMSKDWFFFARSLQHFVDYEEEQQDWQHGGQYQPHQKETDPLAPAA